MPRAPFQVLVYPYHRVGASDFEYAMYKQSETGYWQAIAGGGKDNESPLEAAKQETFEAWELEKRLKGKGPRV